MFEFAREGTGFMGDETYEKDCEKLLLPPFLEPKREQIEQLERQKDKVRNKKELRKNMR
ncbi:VOC family protein [Psychrobacillus glaciei]|uniref:hypothetical protein n=1 Tax=Psychrobacillus glaciei TaxID=2283160 RepID=UPI001CEFADF7|nr:hypothetical protein [Psychrobacillus glaciei]